MQKVRLFIHREHITDVLREVHRTGVLELTELETSIKDTLKKSDSNDSHIFERIASQIDFAIDLIERYAPQKGGGLRAFFEGTTTEATREEIEVLLNQYPYNNHVDTLQKLEHIINECELRISEIDDTLAALAPWKQVNINLSLGLTTRTTKTDLLHATPEITERLEKILREYNISEVAFHRISPDTVTLSYLHEHSELIQRLLTERKIKTIPFPTASGTPAQAITTLLAEREAQTAICAKAASDIKALAPELRSLKILSDVLHWRKEKHDVISTGHRTESVYVFEGWCPQNKIELLKYRIATITLHAEVMPIGSDEEPPVELENNNLVRPFETVTRLYGLPGNRDLDPTLFLAGFFFLFFGLCLTDVGYGVFLALITGIPLVLYKVQKDLKLMLQLLFFGGLASGFVGLFFGGYLGADPALMPEWLANLQYFDPIASPLPVLFLALGLGVLQIVFGLILKIVRDIKDGDTLNGVLDNGPWLLFFASIGLFIANKMNALPSGISETMVLYDVYISIGLLVLTQGRREKNVFMKLLKGILSLYDSVSFFSDILSYSRILALGLATSALAFAINLIASIAGEMIPVVGTGVMVIILIVGHIFNVGINVLGAFIHSARLQFVEFFGKFITASGRPFAPFRQRGCYITIK